MEPVCIFRVTRFAFFAFRALRDFDLDLLLRRLALRRRLVDFFLDRRLGARGLLAVRLFLDRDFEREREVLALRFGARGAAARRRRFLEDFLEDLERDLDLLVEAERDLLGARGLLAVRRLDLERDFLAPLGAAALRRLDLLLLFDLLLEREVDIERLREVLGARGLLTERLFELRRDDFRELLLLEREALVEALLFGARGAAARLRRAFLALRRDADLDRFGARGLEAVLRFFLDRERDFFGPRGVAARRLERLRLLDLERDLERLRDFDLDLLRGPLARFADLLAEELAGRFPASLSRAVFWPASNAAFSAMYFL